MRCATPPQPLLDARLAAQVAQVKQGDGGRPTQRYQPHGATVGDHEVAAAAEASSMGAMSQQTLAEAVLARADRRCVLGVVAARSRGRS